MIKIKIIVNPKSGIGKQQQINDLIKTHLDHSKFDWTLVYTERRNHAKELAKTAVKESIDVVLAVGGDGTINEIGSQLVNTTTSLGILPAGSGNGLARHLGISNNISLAIKGFNQHTIKKMDVGVLNNNYFFNTAGIGFDALIADKFLNLKKRGLMSYIKTTLKTYFSYHPINYQILTNNEEIAKKAFLITFANSSQYGNHATIAPGAIIDDGFLDMCILEKFDITAIPLLAYRLFTGSIDKSNKINTIKGTAFTVNPEEKSFAHIDGEPIVVNRSIDVKILPQALKITIPITS